MIHTYGEKLREAIDNLGVTIVHLAEKLGCSRNRIYAIIAGADCTATEIAMITECLHLSRDERDDIFLKKKVN